jgi:elongation factor Ts
MAITAADVKKLRDATGAGMMDAKNALVEAEGDFEKAIEVLRISGLAKQAKRSDREASNGIVAGRDGALIQFAAETDFVAKNAEFVGLAEEIVSAVLASGAADVASANEAVLASGA